MILNTGKVGDINGIQIVDIENTIGISYWKKNVENGMPAKEWETSFQETFRKLRWHHFNNRAKFIVTEYKHIYTSKTNNEIAFEFWTKR